MRHASLRSFLIACTVLTAAPVLAQEVPPPVGTPLPQTAPPPPLIVIGEPADTPPPTIEAIPTIWAPVPSDAQGQTAYGLYLAARSALSRGESETAASLMGQVAALTPEQPAVRDQAFTSALLAGDLAVAARIGPDEAQAAPVIREVGALVAVIQTFVSGDAEAANQALKTRPILAPHSRAAVLVKPWIAAAAGDWDVALAEPTSATDAVTAAFQRFHRAELLEHRRLYDLAEAEFHALALDPRMAPLFRSAYGDFLERRGRRDEALAFYDTTLASGSQDQGIVAARARVIARGRPPALAGFREGASRAMVVASQQASMENAHEVAIVYLRLSLNIRPDPEVQYLLGQTLQRANLETASRAVMERVSPSNPRLYAASRMAIGVSLAKEGQQEQALASYLTAREILPADPRIAFATAGQLMQMDRYEEGLEILNGPLLNTADQSAQTRFMRGAAYESLGRIPEAEAELWAALQLEPDEPIYLNYLGYLWVDSGTRVAEGAAMIQRAHDADPEDGNIQDSLGWAQYRQGLFDVAVENLEQAVAKRPANAEINDHLGDAYWQVGRRREAGFQWTRVLTLNPDDERRSSVERKLEHGLDAGDET